MKGLWFPDARERSGTEHGILAEFTKLQRDVGIQVSPLDLSAKSLRISITKLQSEKELLALTGISTFELFYNLTELFWESRLLNSSRSFTLSDEDVVLLTLMKLYHNMSYSLLAVLFNVHRTSASNLCTQGLQVLATIPKEAVVWPEKVDVCRTLTVYFKSFRNTRVVLGCTEVEIQRPKDLPSRILTYSNYKKTYTVMFLIGETPGGLISFLSKAYGERTSDVYITKDSGVIGLCEPYVDSVMVDRGFLIDHMCDDAGIEVVRPPFLRGQKQYSEVDAIRTVRIARARVHVERGIQRMKRFKVLKKVSHELLPYIHNIATVIAGIVNLSKPIFADDKYLT
ncbi:uncharacterized protein LOC135389645 [Ornithodoros turicata]|uniref:uncharacterized protein LOC135389645 n=1 Tax=Ornithodoros turicata TaxID=34597 RepID=UPI0031396C9B